MSAQNSSEYDVIKILGSGGFGQCQQIQHKMSKKIYAWKVINYSTFDEKDLAAICAEVNVMKRLDHPNIVSYIERFVDKANSTIYIVMEFCANKDLAHLIKSYETVNSLQTNIRIPEDFIWKICIELLEALQYLHSQMQGKCPIIHRDMKPANCLLTESNSVKLADFGLSRMLENLQMRGTTMCGTPYYFSPELLSEGYTEIRSDIWGLGCILYELMTFRPAFESTNQSILLYKIKHAILQPIPSFFSKEMVCLVKEMLQVKLQKRPHAEELLQRQVLVSKRRCLKMSRFENRPQKENKIDGKYRPMQRRSSLTGDIVKKGQQEMRPKRMKTTENVNA